jgi:hypothetical protein
MRPIFGLAPKTSWEDFMGIRQTNMPAVAGSVEDIGFEGLQFPIHDAAGFSRFLSRTRARAGIAGSSELFTWQNESVIGHYTSYVYFDL